MPTAALRRLRAAETAFPDRRAELIDGELILGATATCAHGQMVPVLGTQLLGDWCVMTGTYTADAAWLDETIVRPDISVTAPSYRGTRLTLLPAAELLLVIEVVSEFAPENDLPHRKVRKYAQACIPRYLIVNPLDGTCLLHSTPGPDGYRDSLRRDFGESVPIGDPIGMGLDTSALYTY
jgi:Uma2 family endonuclease